MAQNTDLNVSPYYDDYDETKNFHRILFRPSNAIQARELTQLQTILQNQVERFGNHIFDEGAIVMGGTITVNRLYQAVKVEDANPNSSGTATTESFRTAAIGKYYRGKTSLVVGKVINTAAKTTDGDPLTLYVNYVATTETKSTFEPLLGEEIEEVALSADGTYSNSNNSNNEFKTINPDNVTGHTSAIATGSAATIRGGILYVRGFFVRVDQQTILLDKYSANPSYRIGLQITESLQSSTDDTSLLDNATGTSNENAPGANRLKIELTLVKKAMEGTQDVDNFIEMSRVEVGDITKQTEVTAYNVLERTLARRTYDESGDYIVRPYNLELREHLNTTINNGVYLSSAATPGDTTKFVGVVSSGKGYVKGFEIDKPSQSFINISKARDTQDSGALAIPFEIGNYYNLNNCHGQPEFGTGLGTIEPFGTVDLYDTKISSDGSASGTKIGQARVRFFNFQAGTPESNLHSSITTSGHYFRINLFDIRMFTQLTIQADMTAYELTAGQRVVGVSSGAKGTVAVSRTGSGTVLMLMDVEGNFANDEYIRVEWDSSTSTDANKTEDATAILADPEMGIRQYSTDDVRSLFQECRSSSGTADFTADTLLTDNQYTLSGTCVTDLSGDATADKVVTGVNSKFTQELKGGDVIVMPSGATLIVDETVAITDTTFSVKTAPAAVENGKFLRQRARLLEQEKTVAISPTPKDFVSSITPNQVTIRKQTILTLAGATITHAAGSDSSFVSEDANDYIISIHDGNTDSDNEGAIINTQQGTALQVATTTNGNITITHAQSAALDADDVLKVIYAVQKDVNDDNATKTIRRSRGVKITTTASAAPGGSVSAEVYGTNINDEIITLGVPDVYALRAVYESNDTDDAEPPKLTLASGFAGNPGDKISGGTSGAIGKIIQVTGTSVYFYYVVKGTDFVVGETVTNDTSTDTTSNSRVIAASGVTVVSKDITNNWLLDDGQRDGYYGLASIKRKANTPTPSRKLLVIFDFFTAGSGNFFTVNSYSDMNFENMPNYIPNITDPTGLEPDGEIELGDAVDYRSYVHSLHDVSAALDPTSAPNVSTAITDQPFAYATEQFAGARAVTFDLPKSNQSLTTTAMVHYLPRIDKISLSSDGQFILTAGQAADSPAAPATPSNAILLHTLYIPAYTKSLANISVQAQDHKRFTMRDIGRIQGRVKNLERVTSLNALEQQTSLHQVQDADGLDRFKSGFVTDNFRGHKTGDVNHPDYKIGVDRTTGTLRPMHNSRFIDLTLNTGASSNYTKTGDLITLPYTEEAYVKIDKASETEFVNPYDIVLFNGTVSLSPSRDLWFDSNRLPSVRRTVEGDYDTVLKGVGNALGTVWNNWQTDWTGEPVTTIEEPVNRTVTSPTPRRASWAATPRQRALSFPGRGGGRMWNPDEIRFEER